MKAAIVVLADPDTGSEESLGRVFNALAAAYDYKQHGDEVQVLFEGAGTRWLAHLHSDDHPAHALFQSVEDVVAGASSACSTLFGASDDACRLDVPLLADNPVPGTHGLASMRRLSEQGFQILTF